VKVPRDWSGDDLVRRLSRIGYSVVRQTGSHVRLTASGPAGEHHITIPQHGWLRTGTLASILDDVAEHLSMSRDELLERLS